MFKQGVAIVLFLVYLTGCATSYSYDNQTYKTADDALAAQQTNFQILEKSVEVIGSENFDKVLVLTPSQETSGALGVTKTGAPKKEAIDYVSSILSRDYAKFSDYVRKSQISKFTEGKVVDYPKTESTKYVEQYDAVIYLHMLSPSQVSWYILTKGNEPRVISMDPMAKNGKEKIASWLKAINAIAEEKS